MFGKFSSKGQHKNLKKKWGGKVNNNDSDSDEDNQDKNSKYLGQAPEKLTKDQKEAKMVRDQKIIDEYNEAHGRGKSLLEQHREAMG